MLDRLEKRKAALQRREQALSAADALNRLQKTSRVRVNPDRIEMDRILSLAFVDMMTPEEAEEFSRAILFSQSHESGFRLFQEQASAVAAYLNEAGGFFPIGVGWGKSGIALMIAERAWQKGLRKIILHLEPSCLNQMVKSDIPMWRRHTSLSVPFIPLGGRQRKERKLYYESGRKGCYIVPYSLLSVRDTIPMLEAIDPELVIADECHNLRDKTTARTKRWMAMMRYKERELIAMSGTITSKSIEDYRHLIDLALKDGSPLPRASAMSLSWARILDSGSVITDQVQAGPLEPLVDWANNRRTPRQSKLSLTVSDIREAYTRRMHSAPGVVSSPDSEIKASLSVENKNEIGTPWYEEGEWYKSYPGWSQLEEHLRRVEKEWVTPNGDEIEHAIHVFKWMVELGSGFYNELVWPDLDHIQKHHHVGESEAERALVSARKAHAMQQSYYKALRGFFENSPPGLDTPLEVGHAINKTPESLPADLVLFYRNWHHAIDEAKEKHGFLVERLSRAVRVCPFKIDRGVAWARETMRKHGSGIIWVWHREMGRWMVEALKGAGIPVAACPAGANDQITGLFNPEGTSDQIAVASLRAHGTGKNLQKAGAQLFLQWPRDAKLAEQTLGRVHRNGVEKFRDSVEVNTMMVLPYDHVLFAACLVDAVYQHQTGSRRKMVYANYDPMPRIFSPEFLKARGSAPSQLNARQRSMMEEKFGDDWESQI